MKKNIYKISTILMLIILLVGIHSKSFALSQQTSSQNNIYNYSIRVADAAEGAGGGSGTSGSQFSPNKIINSADRFLENRETGDKFDQASVSDMIKSIYNILLVLGIAATVIIGLILSIKFMTGSLEEQAKVKEMLVPYVVGCVVIFGAFAIWKIVVDILQSI